MKKQYLLLLATILIFQRVCQSQTSNPGRLTIDRIFSSGEFRQEFQAPISWIEQGDSYVIIEANDQGYSELVKYNSASATAGILLSSQQLTPAGAEEPLNVENFSMSSDESKVLIFTNSRRVWRSNTKGDFWVYDLSTNQLTQLGKDFGASSLMFAKFSGDNRFVAYVMNFNLYLEDFTTGEVTQLTTDGTGDIINGTFDWAYEEEFGCRDGFRWNPNGTKIAFWQLDATEIGNFSMINNTDSIYSQVIPVQYPKVGQDPSSAKIGIVTIATGEINWVDLEGSAIQNYIPGIQWSDNQTLLIQQMNRKQNHLKVWALNSDDRSTRLVYQEQEETWVDIQYPDVSSSNWGNNDLVLVDQGKSFLRMREDNWRSVHKINITTGNSVLISPENYDVASFAGVSENHLFYIASPQNSTQRYLFQVDLKGKQKAKRLTPTSYAGINTYNISPNAKYALHTNRSALKAREVTLIKLPDHDVIKNLISNAAYNNQLKSLDLPSVEFFELPIGDGLVVDGRMLKPHDFDPSTQYPVIFHVYGEPWGQVATDSWIGLWNVMLTQLGYIVIDIDNRGTPCLKGSEWRKSIYRNIGRINIGDLAAAAAEALKEPYLDSERVAVWGWSGGGSSTLNLMFQHPDIFKTGVAVASVANQLTYDNIYQERYMGLPQENQEDFVAGSPMTHAKNLEGNLLVIHGTADDNVHFQNMEMLVDELIANNKQFDMMSYPNRSHGIFEGRNTTRHLYTLITNYFLDKNPVNPKKP